MTMCTKIQQRIRAFRNGAEGSMSVEAVLIIPLLLWAYTAMFVYFDAFRARNEAEKASFVISDALTRVTEGVDESYIDGMQKTFDFLNNHDDDSRLRVTEVQWIETDPDSGDGQYEVTWSYSTENKLPKLTNADLISLKSKIPNLVHGERLVIVETKSKWEPLFQVGLDQRDFEFFVPSSPRFASKVAWEGAETAIGDAITNPDYVASDDADLEDEDDDSEYESESKKKRRKWGYY